MEAELNLRQNVAVSAVQCGDSNSGSSGLPDAGHSRASSASGFPHRPSMGGGEGGGAWLHLAPPAPSVQIEILEDG